MESNNNYIERDDFDYKLGQELKRLRIKRGLTLAEMSERVDKSLSSVHDYEQGHVSLSLKQIAKCCDALNVDYLNFLQEFHYKNKYSKRG